MSESDYDVIVFDLGGVLIETAGVARMLELLGEGVTAEELWRRWLSAASVRDFESGRIGPERFALAICAEFALDITPEQFLAEFTTWARDLYPGALLMIEELSGTHRLACLSNTNALHWTHIDATTDLLPFFAHRFASHEIGLLKPDAEIFHHLIEQLGVPPGRILFFDDNRINVEAARAVGIAAYRAEGPEEVREVLREKGIGNRE